MWLAVAPLPVIAQSTGAHELLLAASAREDPPVRFFVQMEVGRAAEQLQANVAFVLLLSVRSTIVQETRLPGGPLLADAAVLPHVGQVCEPL